MMVSGGGARVDGDDGDGARAARMNRLRVAVIGSGAAGLCAARHILARLETFAPPTVYELNPGVGGTWRYEERVGNHNNGLPILGSMYRDLRTNLPKEVMMFPDFPFDPQLPSFLPHQEVLRYLKNYCRSHSIRPHIRFNTIVEEVNPVIVETEAEEARTTWEVTSSDELGSRKTETFDSVFICSGHYSDPHIPNIPGLENFKGSVLHSHSYRFPEPFSGRSVVVLGAGASGLDISIELASVHAQVILSHSEPPLTFPLPSGIRQAGPVVAVEENGGVRFKDGSVAKTQVLLFCTGYNFTYPFLSPDKLGLEVKEHLVSPLYRFLTPPAFPSLFFIGICKIICPFPHFDCQVQFALGVLRGSVVLPSRVEMEEEVLRELEWKAEQGIEQRHLLRLGKDQWAYCRVLSRLAGFPPLPAVIQSLYDEVGRQRRLHPQNYRNLNYRLVSDTQWELRE